MFSNREISIIIWITILVIFFLAKKDARNQFFNLIKIFFSKPILKIFLPPVFYIIFLIFLLNKVGFWTILLLKETVLWLLLILIPMIMNSSKIFHGKELRKMFKVMFGLSIVVGLIQNLYSFNLLLEIIIIPVFTITAIVNEISKMPEYSVNKAERSLINIISFIGLLLFSFLIYKTFISYDRLFTIDNLKEVLIAPILTLMIFPWILLIQLYIKYEEAFLMINHTFSRNQQKIIKKEILWKVNFNLDNLQKVRQIIFRLNKYEGDELRAVLRRYFNQ